MGDFELPNNIEFLDLSGVDEKERHFVLSSLFSQDSIVKLPWKTPLSCSYNGCNELSNHVLQKSRKIDRNVVPEVTSLNSIRQSNYVRQEVVSSYTKLNAHCNYPETTNDDPVASVVNGASGNSTGFKLKVQQQPSIHQNEDVSKTIQNSEAPHIVSTVTSPVVDEKERGIVNGESSSSPVNKSWAGLFNKSKANSNLKVNAEVARNGYQMSTKISPPISENSSNENLLEDSMKKSLRAKYDDPVFHRIGEFLYGYALENRTISLQPRGLINRSNYCYINSVLQVLVACPPIYNLLYRLAQNLPAEKTKIPIINGLTKFVKEFQHLPAGQRITRRGDKNQKKELNVSINCDNPFEPSWIYKILSVMKSNSFVVEGRQEDAEEFLGCLLDGLNEEMLELIKLVSDSAGKPSSAGQGEVEKEWQVMGPKNKGSVTRRTEFEHTPISDIFGGLLQSRVHRTGDHPTDNIQPFYTLQLHIENVSTVKEALDVLVSKNQLEGVTSSTTNEEVEAWQQDTIKRLPVVLVFHIKCIKFNPEGCVKIIKPLEFPVDLKIENKLLSSSSKTNLPTKDRQYKLFGVVYHDGKEATKGHYVADVYNVGYASWLRYDDASVKVVQEELVLNPQGTRVPYLLFYRRSDSIKDK